MSQIEHVIHRKDLKREGIPISIQINENLNNPNKNGQNLVPNSFETNGNITDITGNNDLAYQNIMNVGETIPSNKNNNDIKTGNKINNMLKDSKNIYNVVNNNITNQNNNITNQNNNITNQNNNITNQNNNYILKNNNSSYNNFELLNNNNPNLQINQLNSPSDKSINKNINKNKIDINLNAQNINQSYENSKINNPINNNNPQKFENIQNNINPNNANITNNFQNNKINSNPTINNDEKFNFSRYSKAAKTGLINLVNYSYLNAILQLLGNIGDFAKYFLNPKIENEIKENINEKPLSFVFQRLFLHLYPYPEKDSSEAYKPEAILKVLEMLNPVYQSKEERNPNDLIRFILNTLHNELNKTKNKEEKIVKDSSNKKKVIETGIYNFATYNKTKISDTLNWFQIKEAQCSNCGTNSYNFYSFNIFELDILSHNNNKKSFFTLNDSLDNFIKPKLQKLFCKKCNQYTQIINISKIYCSPPVFILSLDRKNLDKNLMNIPFFIEEKINIDYYLENKQSFKEYNLTGITSFFYKEQKYKSFCKSPVDQKWYEYNDEKVLESDINIILKNHNNSTNMYIPYLLIYNRKNL